MTTVTISLPESLKDFVETQVQTKGYGNVSEYFRGLLRDAQEREADKRLEALLLESLDDPRAAVEMNPEFWRDVKSRFKDRVERRKHRSARK